MPQKPFPTEAKKPPGGELHPYAYAPVQTVNVVPQHIQSQLTVGPSANGADERPPEAPGVNYSNNLVPTDNSSPPSAPGTLREMQKG